MGWFSVCAAAETRSVSRRRSLPRARDDSRRVARARYAARVPRQLQAIGRSLVAWGKSRPSTRASGWLWPISAVVIAILVLFVSIAASSHQRHEAGFDILDEGAHYDYVVRLAHGDLPSPGDRYTQQTLRIISCVGEYGLSPHGCAAKHRNPALVPDGYSYEAAQQPPLAYLPYLLTIRTDGSSQQALQDARWGGFIWSVVGAGLLVWVAWMLDLSLLELVGVWPSACSARWSSAPSQP